MNALPSRWGLPSLLLLLGSAGCGSGGGGGSGMTIQSCSLQCNDSSGPGSHISCGVTNVFVNQEIRLTFSAPIDPTTLSNNTFQMIEAGTGKTPAGTFALDSNDPTTLIYRPQVTFDSAGNPIFGLTADKTYFFKVPGVVLDLGPYIRNTNGSPNATTLQCTLVASEGVRDANPGRPRAFVTVDRVTGYDANGEPSTFELNVPAAGATSVWRESPIRIVFDDVMNPGTLANPVTGQSSHIRAFVDADGDTTDPSDQVALNGSFTVTIDQNAPRTTVIFTPSGGLPSAGGDDLNPRRIVLELSPQIADLGGNELINAGRLFFTPEKIIFAPIVIEETFVDPSREDQVRTGSLWGAGILATGPGGGSGRLGDLVVLPGTVIVLDTDSEDFSAITNPAIFNPAGIIDPPVPLEITGGVFEFARLRVDSGGVLRFQGSNPARIYVRGVADIQGLIDVSGTSGTLHASTTLTGGPGGVPGPNGGTGGRGGARPDGSAFVGTFQGLPIGGVPNPGAGPSNVLDPATYTEVNGLPGGGIAFPSSLAPTDFVGGGDSGLGWPQPTALNPGLHMPQDTTDVSGLEFDKLQECRYPVPAAPGGGGAHSFDGLIGDATFVPLSPVTLPPDTPGGDSDELQIDDTVRSLSPELGLLRGGGGGGGGGAHLQRTQDNGRLISDCSIPVPAGETLQIISHEAHSSAGGGGGGGALQVAAGRRIILNGVLDASGGDGGSGTFPPDPETPTDLAQAGGGGAGGSVLLQSQRIQIQAVPSRINVSGGEGGEGSGSTFPIEPSTGGHGSPGFLRMETPVPAVIANEQAKVNPTPAELQALYGESASVEEFFTSAEWLPPAETPSGWSGAESCWIRPTGNFFRLLLAADDGDELGWDMRLNIAGQANPQSFRGPNDLFPATLEEVFGSEFGTSPVVVRFQGARATGVLIDPCAVPETGLSSPIKANSLTGWVEHPAELNTFHADDSLSPNIFRFVVLWDRSQPEFAQIEGLEDLTITIQPD